MGASRIGERQNEKCAQASCVCRDAWKLLRGEAREMGVTVFRDSRVGEKESLTQGSVWTCRGKDGC